jgi:hypothetical protein
MAIRLVRLERDLIRVLPAEATVSDPTIAVVGPGEDYRGVPFEFWRNYFGQEVRLAAIEAACRAAGALVPDPALSRSRRLLWPERRNARWLLLTSEVMAFVAITDWVSPWISRATGWPPIGRTPSLRASAVLLVAAFGCAGLAWYLDRRQRDISNRAA